jgi:hypothetical protein
MTGQYYVFIFFFEINNSTMNLSQKECSKKQKQKREPSDDFSPKTSGQNISHNLSKCPNSQNEFQKKKKILKRRTILKRTQALKKVSKNIPRISKY